MSQSARSSDDKPRVYRPKEGFIPNPQLPLREQVREVLRFHHYARRTEQAYWG